MPRGISINIGINRLSDHYGNSFDILNSSENDARNMASLAKSQGFKPADIKLKIGKPTAKEVIDEIKKASTTLTNVGDLLLVTYSGHGNRVDDINSQRMMELEEFSGFDQTWCLYDRQVIDDELAELWSLFNKGVRILFISDSCYSGDVFAILNFIGEISVTSINTSGVIHPFEETTSITVRNSLIRVRANTLETGVKQLIPSNDVFYTKWNETYSKVKLDLEKALLVKKNATGNQQAKSFKDFIQASVISISACREDQKAKDGTPNTNSIFTKALKFVWYGTYTPTPTQIGNFTGDYNSLFQRIKAKTLELNSEQEPILNGFNNDTFKKQKPCFKI